MKKILTLALSLLFSLGAFSQEMPSKEQRLEWFKDAKLGIFIHWGLYGVNGIGESWSMYHKAISWEDYIAQSEKFTAEKYDPEEWAKLFKKVGANYVVMTTKHHDGFALWDTKLSHLNAKEHSAAKRDLVGPFVDAVRSEGMKVGLYYSILDWSHKDYYDVVFDRPKAELEKLYPQAEWEKNLTPHDRFNKFNFGQLSELSDRYNPDLYWFDGDWEHPAEWWKAQEMKDSLLSWNENIVVNSRLQGYGDYLTPEQGIPVVRPDGAWEFCMTMNDNWGYYPSDKNYKPHSQIIRTFVEVIANGGNLLLNIGPKPDGTIAKEQKDILETLGDWISRNEEAVYSTHSGLPYGHFFGPTLLSKDNKTLYLAVFDEPKDFILLKGLQNKIKKIRVLGNNQELKWERNGGAEWNNIPGIVRIETPKKKNLDKYVTIIAIELDSVVDLYRGTGKPLELNSI